MKKWLRPLAALSGEAQIVRFERAPDFADLVQGYVVDVSEKWILLHQLEMNTMTLNGYSALRIKDIVNWRVRDDHDNFLHKLMQLKEIEPVAAPVIDLLDLSTLLTSANAHFPLLTIYLETTDPEICFIGRVKKLTGKKLTLDEITPAAKWDRTRTYKLKEITRVEFGGAYEAALILVSEADGESDSKQS